ncbi:hypothetical protein [Mycobacterium colombiense]|uniref:hypothetical protein n=1 Tax=Mycobacterium colombiense TaxID=339268 RepID=UPI0012DB0581|nr:hypothetical protein [Mycobacterium colombiense]
MLAGDGEGEQAEGWLEGWWGYLLELPSPIFSVKDIKQIITLPKARIYPPFWLNKKEAFAHAFDEVLFPVGLGDVTSIIPIPGHAVKGVASETNVHTKGSPDAGPVSGLRIDCKSDENIDEIVARFLAVVRLYTSQWWVSSQRNPFDAGIRMSFHLADNFVPGDVPAVRTRSIESPWFGHNSTQRLIGFEKPMNAEIWKTISQHLQSDLPLENGIAFYFDAVDDYMGFLDHDCVLHLALSFEVCENKSRLMDGRRIESKNKNLLSDPTLAKGELGRIFRKIVTDRDNIAHGRRPRHLSANSGIIKEYLSAGLELINLYLNKCTSYGWPEALRLSLT